jgi:hypothetical protein
MNLLVADNNADLVSFRVHRWKDLSLNEEERCGRDDLALADRPNRADVRTSRSSLNPQEAKERALRTRIAAIWSQMMASTDLNIESCGQMTTEGSLQRTVASWNLRLGPGALDGRRKATKIGQG